jgi:hypothetical protein
MASCGALLCDRKSLAEAQYDDQATGCFRTEMRRSRKLR